MSETEPKSDLRHALANPLSALLGEVQLILVGDASMDAEVREGLQEIEKLALRMREVLKQARKDELATDTPMKEAP